MLRIAKTASCRTSSPAAVQLRKLVAEGEIPAASVCSAPEAAHFFCARRARRYSLANCVPSKPGSSFRRSVRNISRPPLFHETFAAIAASSGSMSAADGTGGVSIFPVKNGMTSRSIALYIAFPFSANCLTFRSVTTVRLKGSHALFPAVRSPTRPSFHWSMICF